MSEELPSNDMRVAHDASLYAEFGSIKLARGVAKHCTRCPLHEGRTQVVFGEGPDLPEVDVMLVGEGPGEDEDAQGRPFVGRSGRLMDSLLLRGGLPRESIWVTNIVKSRPTSVENGIIKNRLPTAPEIKACEIWWRNEIRLLKPKIIVCIGATSAKAITGNKNFQITKDRGNWVAGPENSELFVTFHPAYILRLREPQLSDVKNQVIEDFKVVAARREALKNGTAEPQAWQRNDNGQQLTLF